MKPTRRTLLIAVSLLVASVSAVRTTSLPSRLSDPEFWRLSTEFSEEDGSFRSDNLLSNEMGLQYVVPDLLKVAKPGRAYMGVGPEQNFTYIVATKPAMAFIVDIRRGNLDLQLMYKALFELSSDRADFVSRLFAKKRPDGLTAKSTISEIFGKFWNVETSEQLYNENLQAIMSLLEKKHGFRLSKLDRDGLEYVAYQFYWFGPRLQYSSTGNFGGGNQPTYADLMTATDLDGVSRSYLATEDNFRFMKDLESKNLLVPIVGNFGGPKAIRAVGRYLKDQGAVVSTFYLSNVEMYLQQDGIWGNFCNSVASLPIDDASTFIRSVRGGGLGPGFGLGSQLGNMQQDTKGCHP